MPNANVFTLEEINQILEQLNAHPGARLQYIGSRYEPIFGRKGEDSIEWDNTGTYGPLTIVLYQGNSYTSRQFVPVGIEITNKEYWANTGNYNAQIEQYRMEVAQYAQQVTQYDQRITQNTEGVSANSEAIKAEEQARENADSQLQTNIGKKADIPEKANEYSNTSVNSFFVQPVDGKLEIKSQPMQGLNIGSFPQQNSNPLPLLWIANGYRKATTIKYGNDYTATNINDTYDGWEPARNHPDTDGKYHIDCTTFVLLVMCGIRFTGSTYYATGTNVGNSYPINFFSDVVKDYMAYEYQLLNEDPASEPEHRRLLASELAKLLDDSGQLNHLLDGLSAAGVRTTLHVGDIVFFSSSTENAHYKGIGHCSIVAYNDLSTTVVIDCSENRGGINNAVNFHKLSDTELQQIKCRVACPEYSTIFTDQQMLGPVSGTLTQNTEKPQSFPIGGVACVKAIETDPTTFTFKLVFPDPVGEVVYKETLTQNQVQQIIMPPDVTLKVTADKASAKYTHWLSNNYLNSYVI